MSLMPWDYVTDSPAPARGLVRLGTLIARARAGAANALLVDNGDLLQGNPLGDLLAERAAAGAPLENPMIAAMNLLGYDAATLGNHEFNYGLDYLQSQLAEAAFPVVSANIAEAPGRSPLDDRLLRPASVLLKRQITAEDGSRQEVTVGVIGFAPPQITDWDRLTLAGRIATRGILEAAAAHLPELKAAGAEIVIALGHTGIGQSAPDAGTENVAAALAALPQIDALVCGHSHGLFPGPGTAAAPGIDPLRGLLAGKPAVMPGSNGSHLGQIDLHLARVPGGPWRVTAHQSLLEPLAVPGRRPVPRDAALAALTAPTHRLTRREIRRAIGATTVPIHSFFSLIAADASLALTADAMRQAAQHLLDGGPAAGAPVIAVVSPLRAGGHGGPGSYIDIPPGRLTLRHAAEIYAYPNSMVVIAVTGATIRTWLERSVSIYCDIRPGETGQPLIDPAMPPYLYDVFDGLTFETDLAAPRLFDAEGRQRAAGASAGRVRFIRCAATGAPVTDDCEVLVAVSSYRYGGSSGFDFVRDGRMVAQHEAPMRAILADHIRGRSPLAPAARRGWSFTPHPGTAAWFVSGTGAGAVLASGNGPANVHRLPGEKDGFELFELRL